MLLLLLGSTPGLTVARCCLRLSIGREGGGLGLDDHHVGAVPRPHLQLRQVAHRHRLQAAPRHQHHRVQLGESVSAWLASGHV